jgi:hypothetical protein
MRKKVELGLNFELFGLETRCRSLQLCYNRRLTKSVYFFGGRLLKCVEKRVFVESIGLVKTKTNLHETKFVINGEPSVLFICWWH